MFKTRTCHLGPRMSSGHNISLCHRYHGQGMISSAACLLALGHKQMKNFIADNLYPDFQPDQDPQDTLNGVMQLYSLSYEEMVFKDNGKTSFK